MRAADNINVEAMADLRQVAVIAVEHGGERGRRFAAAMTLFLSPSAELNFETALGLSANWRTQVRCEMQADGLRHIAMQHFPHLSGRPLARAIDQVGRRYEANSWPHDRKANRRPDGLHGDLYDILSLGPLPGYERLRKIFNDMAGYKTPVLNTQPAADLL